MRYWFPIIMGWSALTFLLLTIWHQARKYDAEIERLENIVSKKRIRLQILKRRLEDVKNG